MDINFFYAMHILNGLNPVPSQRKIHQRSFAIKGVRAGDLLTPMRWREVKALFHITDPTTAPKKDTPEYDVLHKVRPLLEELLNKSIANISTTTGVTGERVGSGVFQAPELAAMALRGAASAPQAALQARAEPWSRRGSVEQRTRCHEAAPKVAMFWTTRRAPSCVRSCSRASSYPSTRSP